MRTQWLIGELDEASGVVIDGRSAGTENGKIRVKASEKTELGKVRPPGENRWSSAPAVE